MSKASFTLYLDESGTDTLYPVEEYEGNPELESHCTLMGLVLPNNRKDELQTKLNSLKVRIWDSKGVIFHNSEIRHRKGAFVVFKHVPDLYELFKSEMNRITEEIKPAIICCSLDKWLWVKKFPRKLYFKDDPYEQAFVYLLERFADFLHSQPFDSVVGRIVVEPRTQPQNQRLIEALKRVREYGTNYYEAEHFAQIHGKIRFCSKHFNIAGLQLSDIFAYPFYINHRFPERENHYYRFLSEYVHPGSRGNQYGHKKWPI